MSSAVWLVMKTLCAVITANCGLITQRYPAVSSNRKIGHTRASAQGAPGSTREGAGGGVGSSGTRGKWKGDPPNNLGCLATMGPNETHDQSNTELFDPLLQVFYRSH